MQNLSPIAIFAYNRPQHLKKCIESLQENPLARDSKLFVFCDGPKSSHDIEKTDQVKSVLSGLKGFTDIEIHYSPNNNGLARSIIKGVSHVLEMYEDIIVLEDDLVVSPDFIEYMNQALELFRNQMEVFSISGYCAPIPIKNYTFDNFFYQRINSWGWASWKNRWTMVDWELNDFNEFFRKKTNREKFNKGGKDLSMMLLKYKSGKIDSWAIRFNFTCFKNNMLNVYPVNSKVANCGLDNSGTHTKKSGKFDTQISNKKVRFNAPIAENKEIAKTYSKFLSPGLFRQFINRIKIYSYLWRI
jgi:hypothetical protein